jgi:hypothetical protein
MAQKLRIPLILLLLSVLVLGGLGFQVAAPGFQTDAPEPGDDLEEPIDPYLTSEAGGSDGIVLLGFLIFLIILVPLFMLRKEW